MVLSPCEEGHNCLSSPVVPESQMDAQASALFFSNAMRSDAFTTEEDRFVKDEEAMRVLVDLKG